MNNFEFRNPVKLIFGKGQISKISKEIPTDAMIMITYGGGSIKTNGVYDQVIEALKGHKYIEFSGIEANPKYETLIQAVKKAKDSGVNYLLAVGGGSIVDGTKFIAAAMDYNGNNAWDLMLDPKLMSTMNPIPLSTVLTLPATASEMNSGAVISKLSTKEKFAFNHVGVFPKFSILDPTVCFSLPKKQIVNGLIDTFVHIMEQYLTYPSNGMIQDRFSEGVLNTIIEIAPKLHKDNSDYDTVANYMLAATMGLNGFSAMGVPQDWATHLIGHELTALHGLDHGLTLALIEPSLMQVMRDEKADKLLQYGERVWAINTGSSEERINEAILKTTDFFESLGVVMSLEHYGVTRDSIDEICNRFEKRGISLGERGSITHIKVREILELAYNFKK